MSTSHPPVNFDHPGLVLRSVDLLASNRKQVAAHFYGRLFGRHPHLEAYFQGHDTVWREEKFVTALRSMMMATGSHTEFERQLSHLARIHQKHHVRPEHFALFTDVLLETLAYYAGPDWTPEVEAAWHSVTSRTVAALGTLNASETTSEVASTTRCPITGSKAHPAA